MTEISKSCADCGLEYDDFRTGLTFAEVKSDFWVANPDQSTWKNKRRNTVLGRWREIKLKMWAEHLELCKTSVETTNDESHVLEY